MLKFAYVFALEFQHVTEGFGCCAYVCRRCAPKQRRCFTHELNGTTYQVYVQESRVRRRFYDQIRFHGSLSFIPTPGGPVVRRDHFLSGMATARGQV